MQCVDSFSLNNKGMLEKVTTQRTQQFSDFFSSKEPILVPRAHDPSGLPQESRALGATISGRLRETGWAEFGYFLCYFKMVATRALVFRPLVKGNEDSGNEIGKKPS